MDALLRPDLTRVVLTGSESVGKTTLSQQLVQHFGAEHVPEFVRQFALEKGAQIDFRDHGPIARGQMALENEVAARAPHGALLVQDTDLVSTVVYCEHYFGRCPQFIADLAVERAAHLYLLLDIDVPWVADGVRDRGDRRGEMHSAFRERLVSLGRAFEVVRGDYALRFVNAVTAVERLLSWRLQID